MTFYLVRHPRVSIASGICYGQSDVPLSERFEEEAAAILKKLSGIEFERVYCSPLSRCARLAEKISSRTLFDDRLMELNFGDWEGQPWNTIFESEEGKKWFDDYLTRRCPNGESYNDMLARVRQFIAGLPDIRGNLLIVTHAGVVRAFRVILENRSVEKVFEKSIAYGQITVIKNRNAEKKE